MSYTPPPLPARSAFPATACPYCRGTWFRANLRGALECAGCGAPVSGKIHLEKYQMLPGFYLNLAEMLEFGMITPNDARRMAGVSTETEQRYARE